MSDFYGKRWETMGKVITANNVKVYIHPKLRAKLQWLIDRASGEVGGLGKVEVIEDGTHIHYIVKSVDLLPQDGQASEVELESLKVIEWMNTNYPGWKDAAVRPTVFFWHSHVNMGTFWSAQDNSAIRGLAAMGGVVVSTVGNKREEHATRLDFMMPGLGIQSTIESKLIDVPLSWLTDEEEIELEKSFKANVREHTGTYFNTEDARIEALAKGKDKVAMAAKAKLKDNKRAFKRFYTPHHDDKPPYKHDDVERCGFMNCNARLYLADELEEGICRSCMRKGETRGGGFQGGLM